MSAVLRFTAVYFALSAVLMLLVLVQSFPWKPTSLYGWLAMFLFAVPACAAIEGAGNFVLRNRLSREVELRTKQSKFSWLRIGYFLLVVIAISAVGVMASQWLASVSWLQ
jgi:hypothetical protein